MIQSLGPFSPHQKSRLLPDRLINSSLATRYAFYPFVIDDIPASRLLGLAEQPVPKSKKDCGPCHCSSTGCIYIRGADVQRKHICHELGYMSISDRSTLHHTYRVPSSLHHKARPPLLAMQILPYQNISAAGSSEVLTIRVDVGFHFWPLNMKIVFVVCRWQSSDMNIK
ncbi:hypothetical protein BD410DRAFT_470580 [Rickenella mellea]|uniref:Uncharacterized protein n=1 Tax=Rickenella mellea TaxID=50990 RepID=A0A4Y7QHT3_9AGAM|nr:hypothetical protein BD410DRAFT_470580 [Rickenella mellea]